MEVVEVQGDVYAYRVWLLAVCPHIPEPHLHSPYVRTACWTGPVFRGGNPLRSVRWGWAWSFGVDAGDTAGGGFGVFSSKVPDVDTGGLLWPFPFAWVTGTVRLYGTVLEAEDGYQSEIAVVDRLVVAVPRLAPPREESWRDSHGRPALRLPTIAECGYGGFFEADRAPGEPSEWGPVARTFPIAAIEEALERRYDCPVTTEFWPGESNRA
jgi:hypothetical protein